MPKIHGQFSVDCTAAPVAAGTEYREANCGSAHALCSKMANSIGIPIEDSQKKGNQHSRLWQR